jgi:hypothetical protein
MEELEKKVAVLEYRVEEMDTEMGRTRDRLHRLESDRGTLKLVVEQIANLSKQVGTLVNSIEAIAERAAEKTVQVMFEQRAAAARGWREELIRFVQLGVGLAGLYLIFR